MILNFHYVKLTIWMAVITQNCQSAHNHCVKFVLCTLFCLNFVRSQTIFPFCIHYYGPKSYFLHSLMVQFRVQLCIISEDKVHVYVSNIVNEMDEGLAGDFEL